MVFADLAGAEGRTLRERGNIYSVSRAGSQRFHQVPEFTLNSETCRPISSAGTSHIHDVHISARSCQLVPNITDVALFLPVVSANWACCCSCRYYLDTPLTIWVLLNHCNSLWARSSNIIPALHQEATSSKHMERKERPRPLPVKHSA